MTQLGAGMRPTQTTVADPIALTISSPDTDAHLAALDGAMTQLVRIADTIARTAQTNAQTAAEIASIAGSINDCCAAMMAGQTSTGDMCEQVMHAVENLTAAVLIMSEPRIEVPVTVQPAEQHTEIVQQAPTRKRLTDITRDTDGHITGAVILES